jgi:hypothetical protein
MDVNVGSMTTEIDQFGHGHLTLNIMTLSQRGRFKPEDSIHLQVVI